MGTTPSGKDTSIQLRCATAVKRKLQRAAKGDGLTLSAWLLSLGLREARKVAAR